MNTANLDSKPRYEILDGLRGVAAMLVVAFHLLEHYAGGDSTRQIINHGYLAVDFFFVLSGFVIGYAYDDRWSRMSTWDFFKRRLVRLHPLVILGATIGMIFFYFTGSESFPLVDGTPWWKVAAIFVLACTMLPALPKWDIRGWGETNPLNGPTWSLMWEYVANILYALVIRHLPKFALGTVVAAAAVLTLDLSLNLDIFGLLAERQGGTYTVIGGWSINAEQCYIGITRLLYPFFCGLLLSRLGAKISVRGGFWWCSLLVFAALATPYAGCEGARWLDGAYNALCILLVFPLVVAMGAGSRVEGRRSTTVCNFLGEISYPLYITHFPLIYLQTSWADNHPDAPVSTHIFVSVMLFIFALSMAWASLKLYDEPVRKWLAEHLLVRKRNTATAR